MDIQVRPVVRLGAPQIAPGDVVYVALAFMYEGADTDVKLYAAIGQYTTYGYTDIASKEITMRVTGAKVRKQFITPNIALSPVPAGTTPGPCYLYAKLIHPSVGDYGLYSTYYENAFEIISKQPVAPAPALWPDITPVAPAPWPDITPPPAPAPAPPVSPERVNFRVNLIAEGYEISYYLLYYLEPGASPDAYIECGTNEWGITGFVDNVKTGGTLYVAARGYRGDYWPFWSSVIQSTGGELYQWLLNTGEVVRIG